MVGFQNRSVDLETNDLAVLTKRIDGWFPEQIGRSGPAGHHALRENDDPGGRGDGLSLNFLRGKVFAQRADRSVADGPKVSIHRLPVRWRLPVAWVQDVGDESHSSEAEKTHPWIGHDQTASCQGQSEAAPGPGRKKKA